MVEPLATQTRNGMRIAWDVAIPMDDAVGLRADVYLPLGDEPVPVILSHGPYGKWAHFEDNSPHQWRRMREEHPETTQGTSNSYQCWEVVDPEKWVPAGYAVVRVDSRGSGRSAGKFDLLSPRETLDFYECIEWAGTQPWSNGKVGLNGISYYAINQWQVAALRPPHLTAMCVWEGASDLYREMFYHGGILCTFTDVWYEGRVRSRQHGLGERGDRSRFTGGFVSGPTTLTDEELGANRVDLPSEVRHHPLFDAFWEARVPDLARIDVPLLSAGNWGGAGLHLRGNVEGFLGSGSDEKWLELHGDAHWTHFYTDYGVELQRRFFGHFLKGEDTGWQRQPRVLLHVRRPGEGFEKRAEQEWPLERTDWVRFYLHPSDLSLSPAPPEATATVRYDAFGDGLTFLSSPTEAETEITGPLSASLSVSSETEDADIFLVLRVFTPDMREVTFQGANEPQAPVGHGWLRASHRKLDVARSLPYRPVHTHDEPQPLVPDQVYRLEIEMWPTSIVIPEGYRLALSVRGRDYQSPAARHPALPASGRGATAGAQFSGVGPFRHTSADDRPPEVFGGSVALHWLPDHQPSVLVPIIPAR